MQLSRTSNYPLARGRKVKTGCRTCKYDLSYPLWENECVKLKKIRARKVKCDESRPACRRCVSTGRTCGGYGVWDRDGDIRGPKATPSNDVVEMGQCAWVVFTPSGLHIDKAPPATTLAEVATTEEQVYFDWFKCRTAPKLPGVFASYFWDTLVLQASAIEPAVLHAVLALSSAHRRKTPDSTDKERVCIPPDKQEQFMLRQYSKGITCLQDHLTSARGKKSLPVILIVCLLFTSLEYLRGRYRIGCTHLETGLELLKEWTQHTHRSADVDECLIDLFSRMRVQAKLFGYRTTKMSFLSAVPSSMPANKFGSLEEARNQLDHLIDEVIQLNTRHQTTSQMTTLEEHRCLQAQLQSWLFACNGSAAGSIGLGLRVSFAYQLLKLHHTMATIMASTCLSSKDQACFDTHTLLFLSIITNSIALFQASRDPELTPASEKDMSKSVLDLGFIPPLYYTATKCRVHRIRLQAIRLLEAVRHKEGIWDSTLAADAAREVMKIEEGEFYRRMEVAMDVFPLDAVPSLADLEQLPVLPRVYRLNEVHMVLLADGAGTIELVCTQYARHMMATHTRG
ncbi:hypothetical protein BDV95DRAFT_595706 [Massariosphaeria phaeospora]|uniref:Zn(2)-C6 fungal-type domain-containing protein n=1 Tax=Massariosphaeria phaeospora TaxID=100035 RepID=A0A7C8M6P3_9PLEO|nr:hypothetical protein BDV95DRAFT_595706 [Massariosphaeria phaeospora]